MQYIKALYDIKQILTGHYLKETVKLKNFSEGALIIFLHSVKSF